MLITEGAPIPSVLCYHWVELEQHGRGPYCWLLIRVNSQVSYCLKHVLFCYELIFTNKKKGSGSLPRKINLETDSRTAARNIPTHVWVSVLSWTAAWNPFETKLLQIFVSTVPGILTNYVQRVKCLMNWAILVYCVISY
jgi:hypothetical protein